MVKHFLKALTKYLETYKLLVVLAPNKFVGHSFSNHISCFDKKKQCLNFRLNVRVKSCMETILSCLYGGSLDEIITKCSTHTILLKVINFEYDLNF